MTYPTREAAHEGDEQQFEEVMDQVEADQQIAALYRQACAERALMGSKIAQEALNRSDRAPEKTERERRRDQNREL